MLRGFPQSCLPHAARRVGASKCNTGLAAQDAAQDVAQDVPQDVAQDVAQDAAQDAAKDVAKDVAQDMVQDLVHTTSGGAAQSASMLINKYIQTCKDYYNRACI